MGGVWRRVAVVAAVIGVCLALHLPMSALTLIHPAAAAGYGPPPGDGEYDARLLREVRVEGRGYRFMNTKPDGSPVTFSPCRSWSVVVNRRGGPPGAMGLVRSAASRLSRATGLQLVVTGGTDEPATVDRPSYQPRRYGDRWAPILVGWGATGDGLPSGRGGPSMVHRMPESPQYVSGSVVIDRGAAFNADPAKLRALLAHELAHVVGLAHSPDRRSLMFPINHGQRRFSRADRAGLARLGQGECAPYV